jgi:hypothetical protein
MIEKDCAFRILGMFCDVWELLLMKMQSAPTDFDVTSATRQLSKQAEYCHRDIKKSAFTQSWWSSLSYRMTKSFLGMR